MALVQTARHRALVSARSIRRARRSSVATQPARALPAIQVFVSRLDQFLGVELFGADQPVIVGRHRDAQLRLATDNVSREHLRITLESGVLCVEDLGSANGTLLNRKKLSGKTDVRPSDTLQIGPYSLRLRALVPVADRASSGISEADTKVDAVLSASGSKGTEESAVELSSSIDWRIYEDAIRRATGAEPARNVIHLTAKAPLARQDTETRLREPMDDDDGAEHRATARQAPQFLALLRSVTIAGPLPEHEPETAPETERPRNLSVTPRLAELERLMARLEQSDSAPREETRPERRAPEADDALEPADSGVFEVSGHSSPFAIVPAQGMIARERDALETNISSVIDDDVGTSTEVEAPGAPVVARRYDSLPLNPEIVARSLLETDAESPRLPARLVTPSARIPVISGLPTSDVIPPAAAPRVPPRRVSSLAMRGVQPKAPAPVVASDEDSARVTDASRSSMLLELPLARPRGVSSRATAPTTSPRPLVALDAAPAARGPVASTPSRGVPAPSSAAVEAVRAAAGTPSRGVHAPARAPAASTPSRGVHAPSSAAVEAARDLARDVEAAAARLAPAPLTNQPLRDAPVTAPSASRSSAAPVVSAGTPSRGVPAPSASRSSAAPVVSAGTPSRGVPAPSASPSASRSSAAPASAGTPSRGVPAPAAPPRSAGSQSTTTPDSHARPLPLIPTVNPVRPAGDAASAIEAARERVRTAEALVGRAAAVPPRVPPPAARSSVEPARPEAHRAPTAARTGAEPVPELPGARGLLALHASASSSRAPIPAAPSRAMSVSPSVTLAGAAVPGVVPPPLPTARPSIPVQIPTGPRVTLTPPEALGGSGRVKVSGVSSAPPPLPPRPATVAPPPSPTAGPGTFDGVEITARAGERTLDITTLRHNGDQYVLGHPTPIGAVAPPSAHPGLRLLRIDGNRNVDLVFPREVAGQLVRDGETITLHELTEGRKYSCLRLRAGDVVTVMLGIGPKQVSYHIRFVRAPRSISVARARAASQVAPR